MEFLTKLLEFRGVARRFFQKYQLVIEPIFRFLISYMAFHTINQTLNYNEKVASALIELGLAAVSVFLPPVILILFCAILAILQVYSASPILAALVIAAIRLLYPNFSENDGAAKINKLTNDELQEIEKVQHMRYRNKKAKRVFRVFDHCSIFLLILRSSQLCHLYYSVRLVVRQVLFYYMQYKR